MINLINPYNKQSAVITNDGLVDTEGKVFPLKKGAIRCVEDDNYAENFGFQWNKFQKTQIDKESKSSAQSKERFFEQTDWEKEDLTDKDVLEVGSGAGRFSQIVLDYTKANLYSVDYSNAVEANWNNNGHHGSSRFKLFQASVYDMPFEGNQFDKVFCFGVLQHTPDFEQSVKCLIEKCKPGGELVVDFYHIKGWWTTIMAKYILRPWTKKMDNERLFTLIEKNIDWLIKAHFFFHKIGLGVVNRFLPIAGIIGTFPEGLTPAEIREWAVLDTFDMFSPEHDHPQKIKTVVEWFKKYGMEITFSGNKGRAAVVKGIKK
jgi:SAM-dependent methyltransferase